MLHFIKKLIKIAAIGLGLLVLLIVSWALIAQVRYKILAKQVDEVVSNEFNKVQLPSELTGERTKSASRCSYDFKVGTTRCRVRYTKYYGVNANPVDEYLKVNKYMKELGWENPNEHLRSEETMRRVLEKDFMPFGLYEKKEKYRIEAHVNFYGVRDKAFKNEKTQLILDKYLDNYESFYYISISADMINR